MYFSAAGKPRPKVNGCHAGSDFRFIYYYIYTDTDLDANVRDRALLYYRMLQLDVCHAERVVNCRGIVSISNSNLHQQSNVGFLKHQIMCHMHE